MDASTSSGMTSFAEDVLQGLSSNPKQLSSRYFYDDEGSRLFMEIMDLPEYYLTRAELQIFKEQTESIYDAFTENADCISLIELGAGDGLKTSVLIDHFLSKGFSFDYSPIDISQEANDALVARFQEQFPNLSISPHTGDYFQILDSLKRINGKRKVLLFLGSNIGNFQREHAIEFFRSLRAVMEPRDLLFVGFDMQKDPRVIVDAYDDPKGVTAAFNLNLLSRINRELDGNFDVSKFLHYAQYRPVECAARSFLISREKQSVNIGALGKTFEFDQWEAIFMEISQKYTGPMIQELAQNSNFVIAKEFFDSQYFYIDSLWRPA
jgi:L-histidine N-alpha-methyltransferase